MENERHWTMSGEKLGLLGKGEPMTDIEPSERTLKDNRRKKKTPHLVFLPRYLLW